MSQLPRDLYQEFVEQRDDRDAIELGRRSSGWYEDFVEHLSTQPSLVDVRQAIEAPGEIDGAELRRSIDELALLAIEEERPAEYALLTFLGGAVDRVLENYWPSPGRGLGHAEVDVLESLSANMMVVRAAPVMLDRCVELRTQGRFSECLAEADELLRKLDDLSDAQRSYVSSADLARQRLLACQWRAESLFQLDRLDAAGAAYGSLAERAALAGRSGLIWFDERGFRMAGLSGMARVARRRGQPELATEIARKLARTASDQAGPDPSTANNLGLALLALDRPHLALGQFRRAREAAPDDPNAFTVFGEADALRRLREPESARRIYAEQLRRAVDEDDWLRFALYADRLAKGVIEASAEDLERLDEARSRAASMEAAPLEQSLTLALVRAHRDAGRPDEAIELAHTTIARTVATEEGAPELLRLRVELARMLSDRSPSEARRELDAVLAEVERLLAGTAVDARRSEIVGDWVDAYGALISLLLRSDGAAPDAAFGLHERAKAPTLVAGFDTGPPAGAPADLPQALLDREASLRRIARSLQDLGEAYTEERLGRLEDVQQRLRGVEDEMARLAPELVRRRRGEPAGAEEVLAALREGCSVPTAAVSFFTDAGGTVAFVLRSDASGVQVRRSRLGRDALAELASALRRAYNGAPEEGYPPVLRNRPWRRDLPAWQTLGADLPAFLDALDGIEHLVIAPHGPLHLLALHAVAMPDGRPLAQRFSVSYVPSLTVLTQLLARPPLQHVDESTRVYVAGVAGREDANPELFEHDDELIPARFAALRKDLGPAEACRRRVLDAIGEADVIHLTCHGVFSPGLLGRSGLLFSDGKERPPRSLDELSPARRRRHLVSVPDLHGHELAARLVTLRACSSGQQRMRNAGDEFEGLSRALLAGGARSVVVSLWNVDQRSSRELLKRFYGHWMADGGAASAAAALARAQRDLIECGDPVMGHPYHWAPFALVGDWR